MLVEKQAKIVGNKNTSPAYGVRYFSRLVYRFAALCDFLGGRASGICS